MSSLPEKSILKFAAWLDLRSPALAERSKRWYAGFLVPFNRAVGIRVVAAENVDGDARFAVRLKDRRSNHNAAGTVHGGAILALAETVHGAAILWRFTPDKHRMFTKSARIDYLTPGCGELFVEYRLSRELRERIESELAALDRAEVAMESIVTDGIGQHVARLNASYVILRRRTQNK